jgi:hypothetical protein
MLKAVHVQEPRIPRLSRGLLIELARPLARRFRCGMSRARLRDLRRCTDGLIVLGIGFAVLIPLVARWERR